MKHTSASVQPDLFEHEVARALPSPLQKEQLAALVQALLLEIAVALAVSEVRAMTKITAEHLGRGAFVYIRQSVAHSAWAWRSALRRWPGAGFRGRIAAVAAKPKAR